VAIPQKIHMLTRASALISAGALALFGLAAVESATPAHAADPTVVVYDTIPSPLPASLTSLGYQATKTAEWGVQVGLAGSDRQVASVTAALSTYACETGQWNSADCLSTPGDTWTHPITVNLYQVGDGSTPGALIASSTETVAVPYRASADTVHCTGSETGYWYDGSTCRANQAFTWTFDFAGHPVVPDQLIVSVAFDTNGAGAAPLSADGPYSSLNVSYITDAELGTPNTPFVGTIPTPDTTYWNTSLASNYSDGGTAGVGVLRADTDWTGYTMGLEIATVDGPSASDPAPAPPTLPTTETAPPAASATGADGDPLAPPTVESPVSTGGSVDVVYADGTFEPYEWVQFVFYSAPAYSTALQANAAGGLTGSVPVPSAVPAGGHTLVATGTTSGVIATAALTVAATLAATGVDTAQLWTAGTIGLAALLLGLVVMIAARRRTARD